MFSHLGWFPNQSGARCCKKPNVDSPPPQNCGPPTPVSEVPDWLLVLRAQLLLEEQKAHPYLEDRGLKSSPNPIP